MVGLKLLKRFLAQCLLADWGRIGSRLARLLRDGRHLARQEVLLERMIEEGSGFGGAAGASAVA